MRQFIAPPFLVLLLLAPALHAVPPLPPPFPELLLPEAGAVPTNFELTAYGSEPVEVTTVIVSAFAGEQELAATTTALGCCAIRATFGQGGALSVDVSGVGASLSVSFDASLAEDTTAPGAPSAVSLGALRPVTFVAAPVEAYGQGGVEVLMAATFDEDTVRMVVLDEAGDEIAFLPAGPGGATIGAQLVPDSDELCVRVIAVDAAGNRSDPSEPACGVLPVVPDCACHRANNAPLSAGVFALLGLLFWRRSTSTSGV